MNGLNGLKKYAQFLPYRVLTDDAGQTKKIPSNAQGYSADPTDPTNWHTFDMCQSLVKDLTSLVGTSIEYLKKTYKITAVGVGFVLTKNDPFWLIDIDNCLTTDGKWSDMALAVCEELKGAAIEISSSGKGLHIIGTGRVPPHSCRFNEIDAQLELYTQDRNISLTFNGVIGDVEVDLTQAISRVASMFFPPKVYAESEWTTTPRPEWSGSEDDAVLLEKALSSESSAAAFGENASFKQLFEADPSAIVKFYHNDRSRADAALASHLAFWTGANCERMERLMKLSALNRDKWDPDIHKTYLKNTILKAAANQTKVYTGTSRLALAQSSPLVGTTSSPSNYANLARFTAPLQGSRLLNDAAQRELFKGCVYIREGHMALVPGGDLLTPDQFRVTYGGYSFMLDAVGEKKPITDAWKAFTESQMVLNSQAHGLCFRPNLPPAAIVTEYGRLLANSWAPQNVPRVQGDVTPFLNHMEKIIPDNRDREILLNYAASVVQLQGTKFTWCPLIQGVPGNGKTLFTECIIRAVGPAYSHKPSVHALLKEFNGFLYNTVFIGLEEVHIPSSITEDDYMDVLKALITNDSLSIRAMRTDHKMRNICCNFIMNSNHRDALPKTKDDRRLAVFYTAQQSVEDLIRDGMRGTDYFPKLYEWLKKDGFAIVADFLWTYPITPLLEYAPETSSTTQAFKLSRNPLLQDISECIEQGLFGFRQPWVSGAALDFFITNLRTNHKPSHNKRRELMQKLGYDWHPALPEGRSSVLIEGVRPKLYVKLGTSEANLTSPAEIASSYLKAQESNLAP